MYVDEYEYGFYLPLTEPDDEDEEYILTLKPIVEYARSLGCGHLRIDADGPVQPNLPTYEW